MADLSDRDLAHIFEKLRTGAVPERALDTFAVGIERERAELHRQLELVASGEGATKFLRGDYGCGKTFMARLALLDAQAKGFATAFVVVSDNDLRFHKFEELYSRILADLGTLTCPRGALGDVLDRWVGGLEESLIEGGADPDDDGFDALVRTRLADDLHRLTRGQAPQDFVRVIQTIIDLNNAGQLSEAGALLSWLSGSPNVAASAKRLAGVKGDIGSRDALEYLRGVVQIVRAAGYQGLTVVVDETETLLRSRSDTRGKSLNGLRQIVDSAGSYPGLLWIFTGTSEFFDGHRGVAALPPLNDRIAFRDGGRFTDLRQPQLVLRPFDAARLKAVALRLRDLYPSADATLSQRVDDAFIDRLVTDVTTGFSGDVGVVPRQYLRAFVSVLDTADQHADYEPMRDYQFQVHSESPEEQARRTGELRMVDPADVGPVMAEDVW